MRLPELVRPRVVLCDADGNLFPSEEPAFVASTTVTNAFLHRLGSHQRWDPDALRRAALGRNFRVLAQDFATQMGTALAEAELEDWVEREQTAVTDHLATVLRPDPLVTSALERLAAHFRLAVVSSSALARLATCFTATGLDDLLPADLRFSAHDSLPEPTSKPDPAVYLHALDLLGVSAQEAVAVEDAVAGVRSAVGAGIWTIGNLAFVPAPERAERAAALRAAGAGAVTDSWAEVADLLEGAAPTAYSATDPATSTDREVPA